MLYCFYECTKSKCVYWKFWFILHLFCFDLPSQIYYKATIVLFFSLTLNTEYIHEEDKVTY